MEQNKLRVAIYCRVASADQLAMETQKDRLCRYAAESGFDDLDFYMDNGYSGLNYNRPAFSRLEADIQAGLVEAVIVRDVSRISRNMIKTVDWTTRLRDRGVALLEASLSCGENYLHNRDCIRKWVKDLDGSMSQKGYGIPRTRISNNI